MLVPLSTQVVADDPIEERQTAREKYLPYKLPRIEPITIIKTYVRGNIRYWEECTPDAGNNWQGAFTLKPTTPIYEVYTLDGWKEITAKEYEILIAISKVSVRVATRRNCIEVTDLIGFF